jgi:hypothetical protein
MTTQEIWQTQALEIPRVSIEYARHLAAELNAKTTAKRKQLMLFAILFGAFLLLQVFNDLGDMPLRRIAMIWVYAAATIDFLVVRRRMTAEPLPADAGVMNSLRYYRAELVRQRDAPKTKFGFSVFIGVPGILLFVASYVFESGILDSNRLLLASGVMLPVIGFAVLGQWLHRRQYNREIAAIDLLLEPGVGA